MPYESLLKGRVSISDQVYLITTVTYMRQPLFADLYLGRIVVKNLIKLADIGAARTLAYVVMPDHVHWLMQLGGALDLANLMQRFKGRSAHQINSLRGTVGSVWQRGFHDHSVRTDERLINMSRYVVMNPVRAGLVSRCGDYALWDAIWI